MAPPHTALLDGSALGQLELSLDKNARRLCGFAHVRQPTSIGILLDVTASMSGGGCGYRLLHWSNPGVMAQLAVEGVLGTAGPQDEYFLVVAGRQATLVSGFTREVARIRAGTRAPYEGRTPPTLGIRLAVEEMYKARYSNRVLLAISDGCEDTTARDLLDLSRSLAAEAITMFFVTPGDPRKRYAPASGNAADDASARAR